MAIPEPRPAILIVDCDRMRRETVRAGLDAAGWRADEADADDAALAALAEGAHRLVLFRIDRATADPFALARAIRERDDAARHVPILGCDTEGAWPCDRAIDGVVAATGDRAELVAAVRPWLAEDGIAPRVELERLVGEAEWRRLLTGLRDMLADALSTAAGPAERAHRIAGLAGTLGFPEVSTAWLALDERPAGDERPARAAARRALHAIERRLRVPPAGRS